jgi:Gram-negative bacterial TonB protein C-terminal
MGLAQPIPRSSSGCNRRTGRSCCRISDWRLKLVMCLAGTLWAFPLLAGQGCVIRTDVAGIRLAATYAPRPPFPRATFLAHRQGVVSVAVSVHPEGRTQKLEVFQAPDEDTAASTTSTLRKWRFRSWANSRTSNTCPLEGRLVFYFLIEDGKPVVHDAGEEASPVYDPAAGEGRGGQNAKRRAAK